MDIGLIANLAKAEKFAVKKHAALRMRQRSISVDNIQQALISGKIIEVYKEDYPLPSCLLLGYSGQRPLHIVTAVDKEDNMLWIITAYEPTEDEWLEGFTKRILK